MCRRNRRRFPHSSCRRKLRVARPHLQFQAAFITLPRRVGAVDDRRIRTVPPRVVEAVVAPQSKTSPAPWVVTAVTGFPATPGTTGPPGRGTARPSAGWPSRVRAVAVPADPPLVPAPALVWPPPPFNRRPNCRRSTNCRSRCRRWTNRRVWCLRPPTRCRAERLFRRPRRTAALGATPAATTASRMLLK